jgi:hypothetical protein
VKNHVLTWYCLDNFMALVDFWTGKTLALSLHLIFLKTETFKYKSWTSKISILIKVRQELDIKNAGMKLHFCKKSSVQRSPSNPEFTWKRSILFYFFSICFAHIISSTWKQIWYDIHFELKKRCRFYDWYSFWLIKMKNYDTIL